MKVGLYEVVGRVSVGARSTVWKGHDPALAVDVALKQLVSPDSVARDRLRREAETLATLQHPHIVRVYDLVEHQADLWLVEEWVNGATLAAVADQAGRLTVPQALGIVRGALLGLAYAHERDVIHGDFAPTNILVDASGESKLVDFELAAATGEAGSGGTVGYASPEALAGEPLTPAADVYAAAAVLARALHGQAMTVTTAGSPAPIDLSGIPDAVRTVLERALSPTPAGRFPHAQAFLDAFDEAAEKAYGAGWWSTAGVGTVAAAATPAVLAGAGVGTGTIAAEAGTAGVVSGHTAAAATVGRTVARGGGITRGKGVLIAAGSLVAAVVAVAVVIGVVNGQGRSASPATTTAAEPRVTNPATSRPPTGGNPPALTGTYQLVDTVTTSNVAGIPVGRTISYSFVATTSCRPTCTAEIKNPQGGSATLALADGAWTYDYESPVRCERTVDGKVTDKDTGTNRTVVTLRATQSDGDVATTIEGTSQTRQAKACRYSGEPIRVDSTITGTLAPR